ncbi:sugar ABC transporter ATP-binding protein [Ktedonobacter sp. SOSP1-85]|uniref:sugar ABC transporter ATP-binding protein n=1 Tax=Ktedonobacter sp. SOSP1-85 TaxID=2778367 RepID=UPI001915E12B|nr:sugar ABC transporter ATP-binding protein [Ktedonobacter sp. SOSP1-85]GHO80452.1 sugar ABC transporter ATP-binding protein [Ktedonobacter sp. SOSP1-85]
MEENKVLLHMEHITKHFTGSVALSDASIRVARGEVHALIGENGAGKSTLIKVLTGVYRSDRGTILFDGQPVAFQSPQQAQRHGISTIYQEVNLVPYRSVTENIFLGRELFRWGLLDWRKMNTEASTLLKRLHLSIDVTKPLNTYNIATQQMVAIARAISFKSKLVIMDEPTSSLNDDEVATLFAVIRQLKAEGVSIIFVSHRLDELYAICDSITILRDGVMVDARPIASISKLELVSKMLGKDLGSVQQSGQTSFDASRHHAQQEVLLDAVGLRQGRKLQNASVRVRAGEIVGLAGLLGSGRSEVARAVFGADPIEAGKIAIDGKEVHFRAPIDAIRAGIGLCSEDRKIDGIIPDLSVRENLTLAALPTLTRSGIVDRKKQEQIVDRFIQRLGIKTAGPEQKIRELSGGNQQKVLLARWLCLHPRLLLLDEPTRGIDVGAKGEIQKLVEELAESGMGVLLISSELEEIIEGSDHVAVLRDGVTVAELSRADISQDGIMAAMAHGEEQSGTGEGA